jgi:hypothetical protein
MVAATRVKAVGEGGEGNNMKCWYCWLDYYNDAKCLCGLEREHGKRIYLWFTETFAVIRRDLLKGRIGIEQERSF